MCSTSSLEAGGHSRAVEQWTTLLSQCLQRRIPTGKVDTLAALLYRKAPISSADLAQILLDRQSCPPSGSDPFLPIYISCFLSSHRIQDYDVLSSLLRLYPPSTQASQDEFVSQQAHGGISDAYLELVKKVFEDLTRIYMTNTQPRSPTEARLSLRAVADWITTISTSQADAMLRNTLDDYQEMTSQTMILQECVGILFLAMSVNPIISKILAQETDQGQSS